MPESGGAVTEVLLASAVAVQGRGLLIVGASGSGKSSLALNLIALGATLVADDGVMVTRTPEQGLLLSAPESIRGRIEARGVGILRLDATTARAFAVVDLDQTEAARLPEDSEIVISGVSLPRIARVEGSAFVPILMLYLKSGLLER